MVFGRQLWGKVLAWVLKVEMASDGQVSGLRSPFYPRDSDDIAQVISAAHRLFNAGVDAGA